jgi:cytoskeleton protein RodZ
MPEIGATLREARMRARIDVSEIEAQTKIRAKYLRALENEEWGLLPGPTFVKSFLRTYAQALDLDGKALVEEYRLEHERSSDMMLEPILSTPQRNRNGGRGRAGSSDRASRGYMIAVGSIGLLIVVLIVLLIAGGGGGGSTSHTTSTAKRAARTNTEHTRQHLKTTNAGAGQGSDNSLMSLSLQTSAPVFVCLLGDGGRRVIPGLILPAGETTPTYHAKHFTIKLGNSSVTLTLDGSVRTVAPSSEPIGYSITKAKGRQTLSAAQSPTCK